MRAELIEVNNFLQRHAPFEELPPDALRDLAAHVEIAYYRKGADILRFGEPIQDLYIVRSGSVETFRRSGELYNRLSAGGIFGQMGLLMNRRVRFSVSALEDTLVYCVPVERFHQYCQEFDNFADFFDAEDTARLRQALMNQADSNDLTTSRVETLVARAAVILPPTATAQDAALTMSEWSVSSVLVMEGDELIGIVTDKHLREKILALGQRPDTALKDIMESPVTTVRAEDYVFEARLKLLRQNLHYLPVIKSNEIIGVLSLSDIVQHESRSSLLLVRGILEQQSLEGLQYYAKQVPAAFVRLVNEDANSHMIGTAMSIIGRSFKQALLAMAEEKFGPPPVPYCFLALGSMARDEQLIVTDQDNGLILDNTYDPVEHGSYFEKLSQVVSDGLAACGYSYCDGKVMATNPQWRLTREQWQSRFKQWMDQPDPQALLNSSIFFDLDGVWGKLDWARQLQTFIAQYAKENKRFLAALSHNALKRTPPLGFFKGLVMEQDGQQKRSINLKRRGTAPLTDLVRVHGLAVGSKAQNSFERLDDIIRANLLPAGKGQDLKDALEYISMVRIRHQALTLQAGGIPDNSPQPQTLSNFDQRNLKEAFQVVDSAQNFLKFAYNVNMSVK